jgi:endonuclease YncB( thermonuclease family)
MGNTLVKDGFEDLKGEVVRIMQDGKMKAEQAFMNETLQTYHGIGRLLDQYLLARKDRAEYGERVVLRLSLEVGIGKSALYHALAFFRLNSNFQTHGKLTWSHYRALLALPTTEDQQTYEKAADEHGWSVRELEKQIKASTLADLEPGERLRTVLSPDQNLPALRGQFYTYRLVEGSVSGGESAGSIAEDLRLDLGFGTHLAWSLAGVEGVQAGQNLSASRNPSGDYTFTPASGRAASFYTYFARVIRVIDGDTIWVDIDCGFRVWCRQKLRFRGIDTPELPTHEGVRAKSFVARELAKVEFVVVTTTKPDKYDRYLADVFYLAGTDEPEVVRKEGKFLNKEILVKGLAERFRG